MVPVSGWLRGACLSMAAPWCNPEKRRGTRCPKQSHRRCQWRCAVRIMASMNQQKGARRNVAHRGNRPKGGDRHVAEVIDKGRPDGGKRNPQWAESKLVQCSDHRVLIGIRAVGNHGADAAIRSGSDNSVA